MMRNFKYVVRDESGSKFEGYRQAVGSYDVLMWARDNDLVPVSVEEVSAKGKKKRRTAKGARVNTADMSAFCWQLATMMEGGISITESLDTIADDMPNVAFSKVISTMSTKIQSGETLSDGIAEYPHIFNTMFHAMVVAGESAGSMPLVLRRLAEYFEKRDKLIKQVKSAISYPIFVVGFVVVIITVMAVFIIPRFVEIFDTIGGELPAFTRAFLAVYYGARDNSIWILPILAILTVALMMYCKTDKGHKRFSRFVLSLPLMGSILIQSFTTLFCRSASTLLTSGVSILDSMDILASMTKNDIIIYAITSAKEGILKGGNISTSLAETGFFPKLVTKMTQVGEQSGTLPEVLDRTADYFEKKVEHQISMMTRMMEPALIIIVGGIVLVVVIALYLPIFSLSDVKQ